MPWSLEHRDDGWSVLAEDGTVVGVHPARVDAIKHQRALYAREDLMASMYAVLDSQPDPEPVVEVAPVPQTSPVMAEILALLAREQQEKSLVASVADQQLLISQQFAEAQAERQALVAALGRMGSPTINVPAAEVNVHVPPAEVNFTAPTPEVNVTVTPPTVNVPAANITVQPADVNVHLPERTKTVTFNRDPLTHEVQSADVTET